MRLKYQQKELDSDREQKATRFTCPVAGCTQVGGYSAKNKLNNHIKIHHPEQVGDLIQTAKATKTSMVSKSLREVGKEISLFFKTGFISDGYVFLCIMSWNAYPSALYAIYMQECGPVRIPACHSHGMRTGLHSSMSFTWNADQSTF